MEAMVQVYNMTFYPQTLPPTPRSKSVTRKQNTAVYAAKNPSEYSVDLSYLTNLAKKRKSIPEPRKSTPPCSNFTYLNWAHFSSPPELLSMQFNTRSRRADTPRRRLSCSMHQGTGPASDDADPIVPRCALDDLFDNAWDVGTTELDVEWTSRRRRDHGDSILQFLVWSVVCRHRKRG